MRRIVGAIVLGAGLGLAANQLSAQAPAHGEDWPDWAYGYLEPLSPDSVLAPPCPLDANPRACRPPTENTDDRTVKHSLPDTTATFTEYEANYGYGPADWYPGDHPPMPDIVAKGTESVGVRACALCHYPNGQGKMENAHVSGLPAEYILQQLELFETGER